MTKRILASVVLSALLAACSATARSATAETPPPEMGSIGEAVAARSDVQIEGLRCEIRLTPTRNGLRIEAIGRSDGAAAGDYELVVTKTGPSGDSDVVQGGPFELAAGREASLSATEFAVARGDRYRARLVLRAGSDELCRDERRS